MRIRLPKWILLKRVRLALCNRSTVRGVWAILNTDLRCALVRETQDKSGNPGD